MEPKIYAYKVINTIIYLKYNVDPRVSQSLNDKENKCTCILRSCHLYMLYYSKKKCDKTNDQRLYFF